MQHLHSEIFIYDGPGVDPSCLFHTQISLQNVLKAGSIRKIGAKQVAEGSWRRRAKVFVMPGGRDVFYLEALRGKGALQIKEFVEEGGGYLGICAGAYFAASAIEFEMGGVYEVAGKRPLQFFPGVAHGPAYGNGKYAIDSHRGVEAALIQWGSVRCHVYFDGGCTFSHVPSHCEVLASYEELEGCPPAVVLCKIGQGKAILSGVHLEYSTRHFFPTDPYLTQVYPKLVKDENLRHHLFGLVMDEMRKDVTIDQKICYKQE